MAPNEKDTDRRKAAVEIAATLHATQHDGNFDPLAFHVQRLLLQHESVDGVNAKALAISLSALTPGDPPRDLLVEAILARLDARNAEKLKRELGQKAEPLRSPARPSWLRSLATKLRRPFYRTRWPEVEKVTRVMTLERTRRARKETTRAISALEQYVSRDAFANEFIGNSDFRKMFVGLAQIYSGIDDIAADPTRVKEENEVNYLAGIALTQWFDDLAQAKADGREAEYLAQLGDVGVDAVLCSVPMDDFWKFGGMAASYFEKGVDFADPAVAAAIKDVSRASSEQADRERRRGAKIIV